MTATQSAPLSQNRRLRQYPRALMGAVALAFVLFLVSSSGSDAVSGRVGGDYPAFYAAGRIVLDDPDALYDVDVQTERQADLLGDQPEGSVMYFAYPPYVALLYAPLAALPYTLSYAVHTALMVGLVVVALARLRPLIPLLDRWFEQGVIAAILFFPMFRGLTGGQTTALVLLLVAVGVRALADRHDVVAGLAFAGILFKPQYALAFLGVSLLIGRWRVVAAGAAGAILLFLVGAAVQGWGWLGPWSEQVRWFTELDAEVNASNAVSWLGFSEALFGAGSTTAGLIGWPPAGLTAAAMAWAWWRDGGRHLALLLAFSCPAVLLFAPHAMYYDVGILFVSLVVLADVARANRRWAVLLWTLGISQVAADALGASPLIGVAVAALALSGRELWRVLAGPGAGDRGELSRLPSPTGRAR